MNVEEIQAAIERLKNESEESSLLDMIKAYMGGNEWQRIDFRDALVDVLMKARASWWVDKSGEEDLAKVSDSLLAEWGYMRLPRDKDGEIIRPGDKVDLNGEVLEVRGVKTYVGAYAVSHSIIFGEHSQYSVNPDALRHHREPTIKDVLHDFLSAVEEAKRKGYDDVPDEEYAECAEKLREVMDA